MKLYNVYYVLYTLYFVLTCKCAKTDRENLNDLFFCLDAEILNTDVMWRLGGGITTPEIGQSSTYNLVYGGDESQLPLSGWLELKTEQDGSQRNNEWTLYDDETKSLKLVILYLMNLRNLNLLMTSETRLSWISLITWLLTLTILQWRRNICM